MNEILLVTKYHLKHSPPKMVILTWYQTCHFTQLYQLFTKIYIKLHTFYRSKLKKPDIVGGLECTLCTFWRYYYIRVPPNLGQVFISLYISFQGNHVTYIHVNYILSYYYLQKIFLGDGINNILILSWPWDGFMGLFPLLF